jgi:hypothetical protein
LDDAPEGGGRDDRLSDEALQPYTGGVCVDGVPPEVEGRWGCGGFTHADWAPSFRSYSRRNFSSDNVSYALWIAWKTALVYLKAHGDEHGAKQQQPTIALDSPLVLVRMVLQRKFPVRFSNITILSAVSNACSR